MKKIFFAFIFIHLAQISFADKFVWNQKTNYPGLGRHRSSGIGIGNKVYYGLGHVTSGSVSIDFDDWWEFDPATNAWTQKANYPIQCHGATGFTIGNKGYMGANSGGSNFYEFDPIANTWTSKANCPFSGDGHITFEINGLGYMGTGSLYSYNPIANTWTFVTSAIPGGWWSSSFVVNNKAYILPSYSNTLYMFDPVTNLVTTKAPFIGVPRIAAAGFSVRGQGYIGLGTTGFDGPYDLKDFYFYDPVTNVWDTIPKSFPGVRRHFVPCVTIGDNVYFGTGTNGTNLNDFWAYEWKISVGITDYDKENEINIFPNPTSEIINVKLSESLSKTPTYVKLYSLEGKEVFAQTINGISNTLNISNLLKGIYFISLSNGSEIISSKKIIIN